MAIHIIDQEWSDPITLAPGDIIQNTSQAYMLICPSGSGSDDNALKLPPHTGSMQVTAGATITARLASGVEGILMQVTGF